MKILTDEQGKVLMGNGNAYTNAEIEHYIRKEIVITSKQINPIVVIANDPMIAEHYDDETAVARYECLSAQNGRYEGMNMNKVLPRAMTVSDTCYGYYRSNANPDGSDSRSLSRLSDSTTSSKALIADSNGNLKIVATNSNYISAGTYLAEFMW